MKDPTHMNVRNTRYCATLSPNDSLNLSDDPEIRVFPDAYKLHARREFLFLFSGDQQLQLEFLWKDFETFMFKPNASDTKTTSQI